MVFNSVSISLLALALIAPAAPETPAEGPDTTAATDEASPDAEANPDAEASPNTEGASASDPAPILGDELDPYSAWTMRIAAAVDATNDDPARGAPDLAALLDEAPNYAVSLSTDDAARNERNAGLLALSRAYLALGEEKRAIATMDEALRSAGNDPLRVERFGPGLTDLHRERIAALDRAGKGSIRVTCTTPCRVTLNEHNAPMTATGLWVGPYRVHIESSDGSAPPKDQVVVVGKEGIEVMMQYPGGTAEGPEKAPELTNGPADDGEPTAKKGRRVLPRWLEVTAIVGGAAAAGAGAFLVLANSRCVGDLQTTPTAEAPGTCEDIYKSRTGGFAAIGAGAAFFAGGVITLSIDESRARRERKADGPTDRTVMLGYTRRF